MSGSWHLTCTTVSHLYTWSPDLYLSYNRTVQVHVGWLSDGTAVLSFRGTATMQDGLADVQVMHRDVHFLRDYFPGSRTHIGGPRERASASPIAAVRCSACQGCRDVC